MDKENVASVCVYAYTLQRNIVWAWDLGLEKSQRAWDFEEENPS